jgi:hypothetical protein
VPRDGVPLTEATTFAEIWVGLRGKLGRPFVCF